MKKLIAALCTAGAVIMLASGCVSTNSETTKQDKIGIIGAMDTEVTILKESAHIKKTTAIAGMEFCEGTLDGAEVVVVKCGIGKVNAGSCAQLLINVFGVDRIINTGVAGSLDASIDIGDVGLRSISIS